MMATPIALGIRPSVLPITKACIAIESGRRRLVRRRRGAPSAAVEATPSLFANRPSIHPISKASMAVIWQGCCWWRDGKTWWRRRCRWTSAASMRTAKRLFGDGPTVIPIHKSSGAIEFGRRCRSLLRRRTSTASVCATPSLFAN